MNTNNSTSSRCAGCFLNLGHCVYDGAFGCFWDERKQLAKAIGQEAAEWNM